MLKKIIILATALLTVGAPHAGAADNGARPVYRAVFQLTSDKPETWQAMLGNIENALADLGDDAQIEVVAHGPGLKMLVRDTAPKDERLHALAERGVAFLACENSMKKMHVDKSQLISDARTVPSGVGHVIRRQMEGWAYIRITD